MSLFKHYKFISTLAGVIWLFY